MKKFKFENFIINDYAYDNGNGNCHIRINKDSIELKNLDNTGINKVVDKLLDDCDLYLNTINGYHYLMNFDNSIAYDIYFLDNFIMKIENLINGKEKVLILKNLSKNQIKSLNQDLSNDY